MSKISKPFLATRKPAGGLFEVVRVREEHEGVPLCCTDLKAGMVDICAGVARLQTNESYLTSAVTYHFGARPTSRGFAR